MTPTQWAVAVFSFSAINVISWQMFMGGSAATRAADPYELKDLPTKAVAARRAVIVICTGRGLATYFLLVVASGSGTGGMAAATKALQGSGKGSEPSGWLPSTPQWGLVMAGIVAWVSTMYVLTRAKPDQTDAALKPWLSRLLPVVPRKGDGDSVRQHLRLIRQLVIEKKQYDSDNIAEQAAEALGYVVSLKPEIFCRRVQAAVPIGHAPHDRRRRRRKARQFAPILAQHMDQYNLDIQAGEPEQNARKFWYLTIMYELGRHGGRDSLARLVQGLAPDYSVVLPSELTAGLIELPRDSDANGSDH
jgi:hypothetical protein